MNHPLFSCMKYFHTFLTIFYNIFFTFFTVYWLLKNILINIVKFFKNSIYGMVDVVQLIVCLAIVLYINFEMWVILPLGISIIDN